MVDYAKWDKLAMEVEEEEVKKAPKVTRLEGKTQVQIGKSGQLSFTKVEEEKRKTNTLDYSKWDKIEVSESEESEYEEEEEPVKEKKPVVAFPVSVPASSVVRKVERGLDANGATREEYYWSQTDAEVTLHYKVPLDTRGKDVCFAVKERSITLAVKQQPPNPLLAETAYPIDISSIEDSTDLDWEIFTKDTERLVRLTLKKKAPPGVTSWWDRVYSSEDKIPPSAITDRPAAKAEESRKVWEEAHKQFREKVKKMRKHPVPKELSE